MKKIFFLITAIMYMFINVVFASEINEEYNEEIMNEVKQTLIYRVNNNGLFSKWGWSQKDVVTQHLSQNNGYKKLLNVDSVLDAATIDNVEYGHIIGVCEIDFRKLDKYIAEGTLEENIQDVIKITDECYIELKCRDITLSYMNINEDERISHFIQPGILDSAYIQNLLPTDTYIKPVIYVIKENEYIQGIYANDKIIEYTDFYGNENDIKVSDVISVLKEADEKYLVDNPRIDYEEIEKQKQEELQQLIEEGQRRDIILYTVTAILSVVLVFVIAIFVKIMKRVEK